MKKIVVFLLMFLLDSVIFAQNTGKYLFDKVDKKGIELKESAKLKLSNALKRELNEQEYEIVIFNDQYDIEKDKYITVNLGKKGEIALNY